MNHRAFVFSLTSAVLLSTALSAQAASVSEQIAQKLAVAPGMKVDSVAPSPIAGLYEVVVNRKVFYVDRTAQHILAGHIFNAATQDDLTAKRIEELSRISWSDLPIKEAIKVTYGKGERKLVVFTDANCSYCRLLEKNLKAVGNVTVYNFLYPVLNSEVISRDILCAKNPTAAFTAHMSDGIDPTAAPASCDSSSLQRNIALGQKYGFQGTPSLIFADGSSVAGALPVDQLDARLSQK